MKSEFINPDSIDVILNNMRRKPESVGWIVTMSNTEASKYLDRHGITNYHVQEPHYQAISWSSRLKLRRR